MGNTMNMELKEGKHFLEIEETLIRDFQDRIYTVDKSMISFVNAIDSTEAACEMLLRQLNYQEDKAKEMTATGSHSECKLDDTKLAAKLLWTIKECVSDHKFVVLECLSKLIHLVIDTGKTYTDYQPELSLDKYRTTHKVEQAPFYDARIEDLQTEIKLLNQNFQIEKRQVSILNEKEKTYKRENKLQRERIEELDQDIGKLVSENKRLNEIISIAVQKDEKQSSQIDCLRRQETQTKQEHAEMIRLAKEYETKTSKYFNEIEFLIEEIVNANVKVEENKKGVEGSGETEKFQNVSSQSRTADTDDSHAANAGNDKTTLVSVDDQVVKIKNQLAYVKEIFETKIVLNSQNVEGEINSNEDKDKLETKYSEMRVEMHKLAQELKTLKERKVIYVQVYFERGLRESAKEKELLGLLELKMKLMSIDLQTVELKATSFVQSTTPLLIICIRTYSMLDWNEYTSHVLHSFDMSTKMALVTFHRKEGIATEMSSGKKQTSSKKIGGIFDFCLKDNSKEYNLDESTVNAIIAFMIREGSRKPPAQETRF